MSNSNQDIQKIVNSISDDLAEQLVKVDDWDIKQKDKVLLLWEKLLAECDDIDEEFYTLVDYLQCQIEHNEQQNRILKAIQYRGQFDEQVGDLRFLFHELRDSFSKHIRYGKRTQEIDDLLIKLTELLTIAKQFDILQQPAINFAGIENVFSLRCSNCSESCRSAFRQLQVCLLKIIKVLKANETDSDRKVG